MKRKIVMRQIHRSFFLLRTLPSTLLYNNRSILLIRRIVKLYYCAETNLSTDVIANQNYGDEWFAMRVSYFKISSITSVRRCSFVRMCVINGFRLQRYFSSILLPSSNDGRVNGRECVRDRLSSRLILRFVSQSYSVVCQ